MVSNKDRHSSDTVWHYSGSFKTHTTTQTFKHTWRPLSLSLFTDGLWCQMWMSCLVFIVVHWLLVNDLWPLLSECWVVLVWCTGVCVDSSTSQPLIHVTIWVTPTDGGELNLVPGYLRSVGFSFFIWPPPLGVIKEHTGTWIGYICF